MDSEESVEFPESSPVSVEFRLSSKMFSSIVASTVEIELYKIWCICVNNIKIYNKISNMKQN